MTEREVEMHSDTRLNVNWFNVNIPTIIAVLGVGWAIASYVSDMKGRITEIENYRVQRSAQTDKAFASIEATLENLANTPFRMTNVEAQIASTNARLDRLVESLSGSVEMLRKDVNSVGTKVEVLSSKIDGWSPQDSSKRTELTGEDVLRNTLQRR